MSAEAFRVVAVDSGRAARTLKSKLADAYQQHTAHILRGEVRDWADYRERVGKLEGLVLAMQICDDFEDETRD